MTFCFAYSSHGISLAAADTRVTFGSEPLAGADSHAFTLQHGENGVIAIPYRYRKIRFVGSGWCTSAGDYLSSREILDGLKVRHASGITEALATIQGQAADIVTRIAQETQLPTSQLYRAAIIGAPFGSGDGEAWAIQLDEHYGARVLARGVLIANWPHSVAVQLRASAEQEFHSAILALTHIADIARAAATMITMADGAPDCSSYAQIGWTMPGDNETPRTFYIEGLAAEISGMSNSEILARIEAAA